jgi:hypothetical protein
MRFAVDDIPAMGFTHHIEGKYAQEKQTESKMKTIKIAAHFSSLTAAVAATGMDLSYNESDARQTIFRRENDQSLKMVAVFADDTNQIWYVINSVRENLNLLHKFEPFFSCIHNGPFHVMMPKADGDIAKIENAKELVEMVVLPKTSEMRKIIAQSGLLAG